MASTMLRPRASMASSWTLRSWTTHITDTKVMVTAMTLLE